MANESYQMHIYHVIVLLQRPVRTYSVLGWGKTPKRNDALVKLWVFQVALLLFSKWADPKSRHYRKKDDKTKLVISFDQHINAEEFERYINNTEWENVEGGHTRTDKALQIANDQVGLA